MKNQYLLIFHLLMHLSEYVVGAFHIFVFQINLFPFGIENGRMVNDIKGQVMAIRIKQQLAHQQNC
jgi:hypothetical protein